jgi:SagB-type dehydrogenase family enzyme
VENAAALVLLSNVFARYTFQYANRGYRYALIDTGHIGENLRLAASSAGLRAEFLPAFHDAALNDLLGLDGRAEAVCAFAAVGSLAGGSAPPHPVVRRLVQRQQLPGFAPSPAPSAVARYHEASELVPLGERGRSLPPAAVAPRTGAAPACSAMALPALSVSPALPLERAIASRRSAERFTADAMALEQLGFALQMARGSDVPVHAAGLDLYLVANRIRNLAPGLYRYCPSVHGLAPRRSGALGRRLARVCLGQEMAADAAAGFVVVVQLGEEGAVGRDRSFRDALIEAGAIAQRLYLAAEVTGLAARNLAAFVDGDLNRLLGFEDDRESAVHLTMLGPGV